MFSGSSFTPPSAPASLSIFAMRSAFVFRNASFSALNRASRSLTGASANSPSNASFAASLNDGFFGGDSGCSATSCFRFAIHASRSLRSFFDEADRFLTCALSHSTNALIVSQVLSVVGCVPGLSRPCMMTRKISWPLSISDILSHVFFRCSRSPTIPFSLLPSTIPFSVVGSLANPSLNRLARSVRFPLASRSFAAASVCVCMTSS